MVSGSENDLHSWWVASVLDMIVFYNFAKSDIFIMRIIAFISIILDIFHRRKFRSQTSDNMDRWKAELGRGREKRRVEERRSEKRKSQKKADADARKGRKVAKHCVFPMIWGSRGSKSRLAKAAGAEPAGQMRDEKLHAVVARSTFRSQNVRSTPRSDHFWRFRSFRVAGARDCAHLQEWAKRESFVAFPKTMAGMGHLKGICKDAFSVAGAVQKTCSWEMLGGQGADFLRGVAFWSIRSVGLLRWFCVTGAALHMTWHQFFVAGAVL